MKPALPVLLLLASVGLTSCTATPAGSSATPSGDQAATPPASAAAPASAETVTGTVVETMNSGGYTYMRLQTGQKEVWIAASEMSVTKGESMTAPLEMPMANFHSNTLNRDFPMIYFVTQVARAGQPLQGAPAAVAARAPMPMSSHAPTGAPTDSTAGGSPNAAPQATAPVQPNAPPAGGLSIADTWAKRASLANTSVTVRGTVVKVNNSIMGSNWLHLQDGSGKAADGTNDLTVTTDAVVKVGDVITVTGTLAVKKDFGSGYSYEAILEKATIK